jgi:hypothetical protein
MMQMMQSGRVPDGMQTLFEQISQAQQPRQPAAAKAALDAIPVVKIREQDLQQEPLECVICLDKMQIGDDAMRMPCGHCFHDGCVRTWLADNSNQCPVCRYELPTENKEYEDRRRASTVEHRPRLGLEYLRARTVRELRYLAKHLGVSLDGCMEKSAVVDALANSGHVDIRPSRPDAHTPADDVQPPASEPDSLENFPVGGSTTGVPADVLQAESQAHDLSPQVATPVQMQPMTQADVAFLSTRSVRELRYFAEVLGVSVTGCLEKRDLLDAIVALGCTDVAAMVIEGARDGTFMQSGAGHGT